MSARPIWRSTIFAATTCALGLVPTVSRAQPAPEPAVSSAEAVEHDPTHPELGEVGDFAVVLEPGDAEAPGPRVLLFTGFD